MSEIKNNVIEEMFALGAHYGYSKSKRHPSVVEYIYGTKEGQDIIDLEKTFNSLEKAKERLNEILSKGGKVIFIGNKAEIKDLTPELAKNDNISYVNNRWIGGILTNFSEIKKRILKLKKMMEDLESGEFSKYTKKERMQKEKEIEKLKKYYSGLLDLSKKPEAIVVIDAKDEAIAIEEASKMDIDVIALVNTDNDLRKVNYPIVANDRSREVIKYIIEKLFNLK